MDEHFRRLIKEQKDCKSPQRRKELVKEVKKYGTKLKNRYYGEKANELNLASEAKDAEEEFRLMKNYTALKNKKSVLLSPKARPNKCLVYFKAILAFVGKRHFLIPCGDQILA